MTQFSHDRYNEIIEATVAEIKKLGELKGGEYAGDIDRLANFRRNGENLGLSMATVWAVYAGKHWDAINQFIKDERNGKTRTRLESIEGRVDDMLVYLILFKCILEEANIPKEIVSQTPETFYQPPVDRMSATLADMKLSPSAGEGEV